MTEFPKMTKGERASPWMTVPEVCEYGRTNKNIVYRALQVGELRGHQHVAPRGTWRVHRDDVDLWLRGEISGVESSIRPHGRRVTRK